MIEHYFHSPRVRTRLRNSPIYRYIKGLIEHLHRRGHRITTIQQYVQAAEHFGRWLSARRPKSLVVDRASVNAFVDRHLQTCTCTLPAARSSTTARAALRHRLRAVPSRPEIGSDKAESAAERLVGEYVEHLDLNCGLALATRRYRARYAREFLEACAVRGVLRLSGLTP